MTMKVTKN